MKFYLLAVKEIFTSWFVLIATILDLIGMALVFFGKIDLQPIVYIIIFGIGFLLASIIRLEEKLRLLDNSMPLIVSNDNLSADGTSISLRNIGGGMAKVTNISSDEKGKVRIIDDHYMETFIMDPGSTPLNIMINEPRIIDGLLRDNATKALPITSIVNEWKDPFFIYVWYQSLSGENKFCTKIKFQSGNKFIRNLGWEPLKAS
jgi:hypothetical protein